MLLLLITITCFNLAGGYAIAASAISRASNPDKALHHQLLANPHQQGLKKTTFNVLLLQVNKNESEEDDFLLPQFPGLQKPTTSYLFSPEFRTINKHFLVHYAAAIKSDLPAAYLLHGVFRL